MLSHIKKVLKKEDGVLIFNSEGRLVKLNFDEYEVFDKYSKLVNFPKGIDSKEKEVVELLCDLDVIRYEDYTPKKVKKNYSQKLYFADSEEPIYDAPVLAHVAVTNKCNMQCRYCSVRQAHQRIKTEELTTEQWKKIIKHLADCGVFQIGFTGGEPTLRKDIHELMRFTESIGCVCNLTTNGWFLSEDFVREMAAIGIKQCQISLDSFDNMIHDGLRGEGSLKKVLSAIHLLQKYGIAVGIDCVVSTNNLADIPNMIKRCEEMKIPYVTLIKLKKGDLSDELFLELVPSYEEYGKLIDSLCYRKNEMPNVTIDCASISNLQFGLRDDELTTIPTAGCPVGHNLICLAPNGDVYPCAALMDEKFKLGNLLMDDFEDIWKNNKLLKNLRNIKRLVQGKCKSCDRLDFCRGGCRGIAYTLSDKILYSSDDSCGYNI